ncbi:MAG: helix-turn-helix transcriptional regulator [Patulibacter sp.]
MAKASHVYSRRTLQAAALLGLQVKQARVARSWSVRELAERVGASPPTITKVERGDPTVGLGIALEAAVILGVPLLTEEPSRLAPELQRQRALVQLLPQRVHSAKDAVDDDF